MLFEAMQIAPTTRLTLQVTSALLWKFREEIWSGLQKSKNVPKTAKIEGYNTRFRTFLGLSSKLHGTPRRGMGGLWKGVMWLGTNMWMPLCSFQCNFWFHEKWTNGVFRGFSRQCKFRQPPVERYKITSAFERTFREKIWPGPAEVKKMSQKQPKLKIIIHAFGFSRGPSSEHHRMPPRGMRGHCKGVMWLGTNMWRSLRSFQCNFGFHEKWTNGVFRCFSRQCKLRQRPV